MVVPPALEQCKEPHARVRSNKISREKTLVAKVIVAVMLAFFFVEAKYGIEVARQQCARPFGCDSVVVQAAV